jgi:hypothetical protein
MQPDDVRGLRALVDARRGPGTPFDIALGGRPRRKDWKRDQVLMRSLAEAGATWYVEYLPPGTYKAMHAAVARGPLRVD